MSAVTLRESIETFITIFLDDQFLEQIKAKYNVDREKITEVLIQIFREKVDRCNTLEEVKEMLK